MSSVTKDDLLAAVFAELDASMPQPIQPLEFSVRMYQDAHPGMSNGQAKERIAMGIRLGKIERLPTKRLVGRTVVYVYRATKTAPVLAQVKSTGKDT